jgi:hypothetical protein
MAFLIFLRVMWPNPSHRLLTWAGAAASCWRTSVSGHGKIPRLRCRQRRRCRFRWLDSTVRLLVVIWSRRPKEAEERCEPRPQRTLQHSHVAPKPFSACPMSLACRLTALSGCSMQADIMSSARTSACRTHEA